MAYTAKEVLEIMHEAANLGLTSIVIDGVKMEFAIKSTEPLFQPQQNQDVPEMKMEQLVAPYEDELDDDDLLYWSCPYGTELEEQKELKKAKMKERTNE